MLLVADIHAGAALAGAAVIVVGRRPGCLPAVATASGFVACFALRMFRLATAEDDRMAAAMPDEGIKIESPWLRYLKGYVRNVVGQRD